MIIEKLNPADEDYRYEVCGKDGEVQENHDIDATPEERKSGKGFRTGSRACMEKLAAYEDAEEQGRLLTMPFPIGSNIFCAEDSGVLKGRIFETTVHGYAICEWQGFNNIGKDPKFIVTVCSDTKCNDRAVLRQMKNVFATHKEAEDALRERESK